MMDSVLTDMRFAVRHVYRRRFGTVLAIVTLALGISANSSMFTLLNALLFKPPAAAHHEQLVQTSSGDARLAVNPLSYPDYVAIREQARTLSGVLAYAGTQISLGGAVPQRLNAVSVSGNYFQVLGIRPALGRTFTADEDRTPGAHPVVVLGHALWTRRFAADSGIVDSTIVVNGARFTVVGVAPEGFGGLEFDEPAELFLPFAMIAQVMPSQAQLVKDEGAHWLRVVARMAPNATLEQVRAELASVASRFDAPGAKPFDRLVFAARPMAGGLDPSNRRELVPIMALLSLVPLLVLLVACANAANMQLAQGFARRRELAVRRALGASRSRAVRQLLTESVLLALAAGALGVLLSFWLTSAVLRLSGAPAFLGALLTPDPRVLAATTGLAMLTGIVFGLVPALSATSPALLPALKDDGSTFVLGRQRHRLRSLLVTGQVTVSLVLVVTAGLFLRSLDKALSVDPGFDYRHGATVSFDLGLQGYSKSAREAFQNRVLERSRAIPGVTSAAFATVLPLSGRMWGNEVQAESDVSGNARTTAGFSSVSPDYLKTMGVPLVRGREFSLQDNAGSAPVVIVDEQLAARLWPKEDAVGKRLRISGRDEPLREVIGVARHGHYDSLTEEARGFLYLPFLQYGSFESSLTLVVRTTGAPGQALAPLAAIFKRIDPNLPLYRVQTLAQAIAQVVDKQRAVAALLGIFGTLALLLAGFGMYGVTAHGVSLRTREIGIRMSLGARAVDVLALFVREGLRLSLMGVTVGLVLSAALSRALAGFLFGLAPTDVLTFATGALVLCVVAVIASYVPARRAARLDPLVALRAD